MKTPEKPKRLCACCDHYEVCQFHSHTGVLHELNANRCGLYSDRTHDRKRIAVLEQVVEEGNMQIQQLEAANAELLTRVEQLTSKCHQLERERDAAVKDCACFPCETCEERENGDNCSWCAVDNGCRSGYVWRGVKEADHADAT